MPTTLPRDLSQLRSSLPSKLAACGPAVTAGCLWVVSAVDDFWDERPVQPSTAIKIDQALSPHFDAIMAASRPPDIQRAVDELVTAWKALAPTLSL